MFTFIVPVKSAQVSSDWEAFSRLFERTLRSICNQKNGNFRVVVACQEIPNIQFEDERVEFLVVDFPPPTLVKDDWEQNRQLKEGDKANKILVAYKKAIEYNPKYIMVVDADDLISNKIVDFALKSEGDVPGWYIKKGYYHKEGTKYLFLNRKAFNKFCGSCIIIRQDLFPELVLQEPFLYYDHFTMKLPGSGINLIPLPFPGALYSMDNGENHFMSMDRAKYIVTKQMVRWNIVKGLWSKATKYSLRFITTNFKKSFGYYPLA